MIQFVKSAQTSTNSGTGPLTTSYSVNPGDCVVIAMNLYYNTTTITGITDNGGNVYNQAFLYSSPTGTAIVFFVTFATQSATIITINFTVVTSGNINALISTYSSAGSVGSNTSTNNSATAVTTFTVTSTIASTTNWMIASFVSRTATGTVTPLTGNLRFSNPAAGTGKALVDNTGSLSETCAVTIVTASNYAAASIELVAALPNLSSISPVTGQVGTTIPITLSGTNLTGTTAINLSGTGITVNSIAVVNDSTVTANFVIASGAPLGVQTVTVTNPIGTSNSVNFTVTALPAPVLSSMSPNTAAVVNPTFTVTFHGTNLTGTTVVNVGGAPILVSNISVINDTTVTANFSIPEGAATGTFNISLTTPNGTSNTLPFTLTLRPSGQAIFYDRIPSMWAFRRRRK